MDSWPLRASCEEQRRKGLSLINAKHAASDQEGTMTKNSRGVWPAAAVTSRTSKCRTMASMVSFTKGGLASKQPLAGWKLVKKDPRDPNHLSVSGNAEQYTGK
jgi:hypothetical protein